MLSYFTLCWLTWLVLVMWWRHPLCPNTNTYPYWCVLTVSHILFGVSPPPTPPPTPSAPWGWPIRGSAVISDNPTIREKPHVIDPGIYLILRLGQSSWSGGWCVRLWTDRLAGWIGLMQEHLAFPPVVHDWVNKGLGMLVCWHVQPCLCDWAYNRSRATYRKE